LNCHISVTHLAASPPSITPTPRAPAEQIVTSITETICTKIITSTTTLVTTKEKQQKQRQQRASTIPTTTTRA
jgi:hypothetical protein